jgi:succinate dehydrogenase/fumarate reductase iron-sulfur protein
MEHATVHVERYDPATGDCRTQTYPVQLKEGDSVLQALLRIYETQDSTLAFRYACRGSKCGQCVMEVNGTPRLTCMTLARREMKVSPLKRLPRLRDLLIDRSPIDRRIRSNRLFLIPDAKGALETIPVPVAYKRLIGCLECYGCMATCPRFDWKDESFGGPYVFVRLALLHLDPRDSEDRLAQAHSLGIEECRDCTACRCVKGIPIRKTAIEILLEKG